MNPGQVPVIAADQPLFAMVKQIQWQWPDSYGESQFVIMFGGLHIEMAALRSLGTLLDGSGWVATLEDAGIPSANSFQVASNVNKTLHAHHMTACVLYKLMKQAFSENPNDTGFDEWIDQRAGYSPHFAFWNMVLDMQLTIFLLVRSFREADFKLYCEALYKLIPYFFANNNNNYARWIPIHLNDMMSLDQKHPDIAHNLRLGHFTINKTCRSFSALQIDHAHEQNNSVIKGDG